MRKGFFTAGALTQTVGGPDLIPKCGACGLYKTCESPKIATTGRGRKRILILGEFPSKEDDQKGAQFQGKTGRLLRHTLTEFGVNPDRDVWFDNAVICHPKHGKTPDGKVVDYCRPNLTNTLERVKPDVIIPMGPLAVASALTGLWREEVGVIGKWVGWQIPCQVTNTWICPTYHPSFVLKQEDNPTTLWWRRHLEAALELDGRPWPDGPPDYRNKIKVIRDPDKAAAILDKMVALGGPLAFDYETDRLKPDHRRARIVSAAVCWRGRRTIAFPWFGAVIAAMRRLIRCPAPKIAANLKFEERWTRRMFGCGVRNWAWDTMLAAHLIDNRRGITGLKFQSFVLFGQPDYSGHIEPYFDTVDSNSPNTVKDLDLDELLLYNGLDAYLEYKVAFNQQTHLGYGCLL